LLGQPFIGASIWREWLSEEVADTNERHTAESQQNLRVKGVILSVSGLVRAGVFSLAIVLVLTSVLSAASSGEPRFYVEVLCDGNGEVLVEEPGGADLGQGGHFSRYFERGKVLVLIATPALGYRFEGWHTANSLEITSNAPESYLVVSPDSPYAIYETAINEYRLVVIAAFRIDWMLILGVAVGAAAIVSAIWYLRKTPHAPRQ